MKDVKGTCVTRFTALNAHAINMNGIIIFNTISNPINGGLEIVKKQKTAAGSKLLTLARFPVPNKLVFIRNIK